MPNTAGTSIGLRSTCGDASLAQDLTAETFARAWIGRERIRVGTVKAYLPMIARNLYRDLRRRTVDAALPVDFEVPDLAATPEAAAAARSDL
jgi:DNA-directed RNA polymerase specialized sigma24 family protein